MKTIFLTLFSMLLSLGLSAQPMSDIDLSGQVLFNGTDPVPSYPVEVSVNNNLLMLITDAAGQFDTTISAPTGVAVPVNVTYFDLCTGVQETISLMATPPEALTVLISVCDSIVVPPPPSGCDAYFFYEQQNPSTLEVQFFDLSFASEPINSWSWNFGDGNSSAEQEPNHTYANPGEYEVSLTIDTDSCTSTYTQWVYVDTSAPWPDCVAGFTFSSIDSLTVAFQDWSFSYNQTPVDSWFWDFGDGNTSTQQNPQHTYTATGFYTVTLTITSGNCTSTVSYDVKVGAVNCVCPTVFDPVCVVDSAFGDTLFFENGCYAECAGYDSTTWIDCWNNPGGMDCDASFFYHPVGPNGLEVQFMDLSFANSPIVDWSWDFGDGNTGMGLDPIHTYDSAGVYDVTLTITTEDSCTSTVVQHICIGDNVLPPWPTCQAFFSFTQDSVNLNTLYFQDESFTDNGNVVSWEWDFGDGTTSTAQNPTHTYAQESIYEVSLTITTDDSCSNTIVMLVWTGDNIMYPSDCQALFIPEILPNNLEVSFFDFSFSLSGIDQWSWDFGDGNTSNEQFPIHTYAGPGIYPVKLEIVSIDGCSSSILFTIDLMQGNFTGNMSEAATVVTSSATTLVAEPALSVYPNPFTSWVKVDLEVEQPGNYRYELISSTGQVVQAGQWNLSVGQNSREVKVDQLPTGFYLLQIQSGAQRIQRKLIKQ